MEFSINNAFKLQCRITLFVLIAKQIGVQQKIFTIDIWSPIFCIHNHIELYYYYLYIAVWQKKKLRSQTPARPQQPDLRPWPSWPSW